MKIETISKIEQAVLILQEAQSEIPGNERFYNDYYANITLFSHIQQLQNYIQHAKDTNEGLSVVDVLKRNLKK